MIPCYEFTLPLLFRNSAISNFFSGFQLYTPINVKAKGGEGGHRVGILSYSKKKLSKSPPGAKTNCQKYKNFLPWGKGRRSYTLQSLHNVWMQETTQLKIKPVGLLMLDLLIRNARIRHHSKCLKPN